MASVYEVRDCTCDEMYFSLGLFDSPHAAITAICEESEKDSAISEHADDYEIIKIIERKLGLGNHDKTVFVIERENRYIDAEDVCRWQSIIRSDKT